MVDACIKGDIDVAGALMDKVHADGFAVSDVIGTLFKVIKGHTMPEELKLAYMKELGVAHLRMASGLTSKLQLDGLLAKLVFLRRKHRAAADAAAAAAVAAAADAADSKGGGGAAAGAGAAGGQ